MVTADGPGLSSNGGMRDAAVHEGQVKSFDVGKGFGFIRSPAVFDLYNSDVFVHKNEICDFGVGDHVLFEVGLNKRGQPQATELRRAPPDFLPAEGAGSIAAMRREGGPRHSSAEERDGSETMMRFVTGVLKSFDSSRGFGFIRCPEVYEQYGCDVFVHYNQLHGFDVGDCVQFATKLGKNGKPQALELSAGDPDTLSAVTGACDAEVDDVELNAGIVKSFDPNRGFGFIRCPSIYERLRVDVFVHQSQISNFQVGDHVRFAVKMDKSGRPQATALFPDTSAATEGAMPSAASNDDLSASASAPTTGGAGSNAEAEYRGAVKCYDADKGYGFIRCSETHQLYGGDVFVRSSDILDFQLGDSVRFYVKLNKKGQPQAVRLSACCLDDDSGHVDDGDVESFVGTVKSFDQGNGFGFISCPDTFEKYGRDVFLHGKQIQHFKAGDHIRFYVRINNQGQPQAFGLREAPKTAGWLLGFSEAQPSEKPEQEEEFIGEVKSFSSSRGYGFIDCPTLSERFDGRDVFIHQDQYHPNGLCIGDTVAFKLQVKKGQPQAWNVKRVAAAGDRPAQPRGPAGAAAADPVLADTLASLGPTELGKKLLRACASACVESPKTVATLLRARADTEARDVAGQTALMVSALNIRHGERKCRLLLEHRADVQASCGADGSLTVLQWTRERTNANFATFLEQVSRGEAADCAISLDNPGRADDM